jgi:hypothetical protein
MLSGFILVMALVVVLVAGIFVMGAMSMRRQPGGGDRRLTEDSFARFDDALERQAVPVEVDDEETGRFGDLDRWRDDGGHRSPAGPRQP